MKRFYCMLTFLMAVLLLVPGLTLAQDMKVTMGLGVGAAPDYEGSDDYQAIPLAYVNVKWDEGYFIDFSGTSLKVNIVPSNTWSFGPMFQYMGERDDVDSDAVDAMDDVDASFMAGVFGGYRYENWHVRLHGVQDVADGNEGLLVQLGGGYTWKYSQTFRLTFDLSTTYADEDYMDAYFDVDAADSARSGLSTYDADGGLKDVGLSLRAHCSPYEHWSFTGLVGYKKLLDEAADSPVVDDEGDENQFMGGFMVTYEF